MKKFIEKIQDIYSVLLLITVLFSAGIAYGFLMRDVSNLSKSIVDKEFRLRNIELAIVEFNGQVKQINEKVDGQMKLIDTKFDEQKTQITEIRNILLKERK